jgi:hypothetical protein
MNEILPKTNWIRLLNPEITRKLSDGGYMPTNEVEGTPFVSEPKNSLLSNYARFRWSRDIFEQFVNTSRYLIWI